MFSIFSLKALIVACLLVWASDGAAINVLTDFGARDDNATDNSVALQAAFNVAPAGSTLFFPFNSVGVYRLSAALLVTRDRITVKCSPGTTLYWTALGTGVFQGYPSKVGIQVTGHQFRLEDCTLRGPHVGVYIDDAYLVTVEGISTVNRLQGLKVLHSEFFDAGSGCLITSFVDRVFI